MCAEARGWELDMKKYAAVIAVAAVILIPALLFFTMCLPFNLGKAAAEYGELDLWDEDLENSAYALNGSWKIVFGRLLPLEELEDLMENAEFIKVPSTWEEQGYPRLGAATYRLTVRVPDSRQAYMLMMNSVSSAYALYVNSELLYECGTVTEDAGEGYSQYSNALVPVYAEEGVIDIVLHVSNYEFYTGGISNSIFFGRADSVQRYFIRTRTMHALALGCILITGFYHMLLFFFRRREKEYILFSLLCTLCFVRFLFETDGLNEYFQIIPDDMLSMRLYMTLLALHSASIILFALFIFDRSFLIKHKVHASACFAGLGLIFWFMPINMPYSTMLAAFLILVFALLAIVKAARSPVLKENPWTRLYFISLFLFLCMGLTKLTGSFYLYMPGLVSNLFMILTQSLLLSQSYAGAFKLVEETNQNLEQLVDERTKSLQAANEAMRATNAAMIELVSNISHDLKTPLTVLGQYLEILDDDSITLVDEERSDYIHVAYNKNLNMQRLVRNLFEITRIESGQYKYNLEWQSVSELTDIILDKYGTYVESRGLSFSVECNEQFKIWLDKDKIWGIFDNIIYNAVRHTPKGGLVSVAMRYDGAGACEIKIADTGQGINAKHLPYIFDRFYKADQSRSGSTGDSGIGLYIVKTNVGKMGGHITVESELGKGTAFIVKLTAENG